MIIKQLVMGVLSAFLLLSFSVQSADEAVPAGASSVEFITLGTGGGPLMHSKRARPSNAVVVDGSVYLFDLGSGVLQQLTDAGLSPLAVKAAFVSHHHYDHNADLGSLVVGRWLLGQQLPPLAVVGPIGTEHMANHIAKANMPVERAPLHINGPPKPPLISSFTATDMATDMDAKTLVYEDKKVKVFAVTNNHYNYKPESDAALYSRSYSYRIEAGGRSFVYSGDTGPSENLTALAEGADILFTEVIDLDAVIETITSTHEIPPKVLEGMKGHLSTNHVTPEAVGKMAAKAGVKKLVLTHLVPGGDNDPEGTSYTNVIADYYKGPVVVANDLDRF